MKIKVRIKVMINAELLSPSRGEEQSWGWVTNLEADMKVETKMKIKPKAMVKIKIETELLSPRLRWRLTFQSQPLKGHALEAKLLKVMN